MVVGTEGAHPDRNFCLLPLCRRQVRPPLPLEACVVEPTRLLGIFPISHESAVIALNIGIVAFVLLAAASGFIVRRLRQRDAHLETALNNMSQGLCMWNADARLILCNERYVQMYGLPPALVTPGLPLRDLLARRTASGSFSGNPDEYIAR